MARIWTKPMEWQNEGTEPSAELKQAGFMGGYRPPADIFNYFLHRQTVCIEELQGALDEAEAVLADFDCGYFDGYSPTTNLQYHMKSASTHGNLKVDGNLEAPSETGDTLEEHEVDPNAHQNLQIDGNNT